MVQSDDLFKDPSWFAVLMGQGLYPRNYHAVADAISENELKERLMRLRSHIQMRLKPLPTHEQFLAKTCPAKMLEAMS